MKINFVCEIFKLQLMKKSILPFLFLISLNIFSQQSDWFWQNPVPQGDNLNSVFTINNNTAIAVGDCGVIIKTTNGGINWDFYNIQDTNIFKCIYFINSLTGWIAGGTYSSPNMTNVILKTTNGGQNWIYQQASLLDHRLNTIYFINNMTGYCAGGNFTQGKVNKTTNGGINWIDINTSFNSEIYSLFFINPNTGWAGFTGKIAKTTNGGVNWYTVTGLSGNFVSINFLDTLNGFAGKQSGVTYRTTNGGDNWFTTSLSGRSIFFINQYTGWITGSASVYKTTDAGHNWLQYNCQTNEQLNSISFGNAETGWTVGLYGTIQKTTDGGITWHNGLEGFSILNFGDANFVNENTGYIVGGLLSIPNPFGFIYKTTNSGNSWNEIYSFSVYFEGIDFINLSTGWVCGTDFESNEYEVSIFKTTDSGTTWDQQYTNLGGESVNVDFIDQNTGFVVSRSVNSFFVGTVFKTTNGGVNWSQFSLGLNTSIMDSYFLDSNTGWLSCMQGKVFKTTNSGVNWIFIPTGLTQELRSIYFMNSETGWLSSINGAIYGTTNGGTSWFDQCWVIGYVSDITFVNNQLGWGTTNFGELIYTTNLGVTWKNSERLTYNSIGEVLFITPETGWLIGNRTILKTTNGGGLLEITTISQNTPIVFSLSQNFPNPFNPVTNIKYEIPKLGLAKLTIYDLLGREIVTLVNEQLQPGSYSVNWDASNFPSGVYFYRIEADDFVESRKMVLLK